MSETRDSDDESGMPRRLVETPAADMAARISSTLPEGEEVGPMGTADVKQPAPLPTPGQLFQFLAEY